MSPILVQIQSYLDGLSHAPGKVPDEILDEFAAQCREALRRQIEEQPASRGFTLRMSNVGKPLCQLQMERDGAPSEVPSYSLRMRMLFGDLTEAATLAIMRLAGVPIQAVSQQVSMAVPINKTDTVSLNGTYDVKINNAIYDIKSASSYSFRHKFSGTFEDFARDDPFGYVAQGFGYAAADNALFGGWIAVNKETGEFTVLETPRDMDAYQTARRIALGGLYINVSKIVTNAPFERQFTDEAETYYKKETGNRVLSRSCQFCSFKRACWPDAQYRPKTHSKSASPEWEWYTEVKHTPNDTKSE
ncbi:MAG: hypothetical protein IM557_10455 [Chitinophagaceae bacterium]|nr:hypothetical protein [Chitinophagaceae bacterium]